MTELLNGLGGIGLASAAGLNAYIPAVLTALLARYTDLVTLPEEFDFLANGWVLAVLIVLLVIEEIVDKVPGADHINDIVQTVVRPASGAVMFASATTDTFGDQTWLALLVGLVVALTVHGTKATSRGLVNVSTGGIGAPVASIIEDVAAVLMTLVAIIVPVLVVVFLAVFVWAFWAIRRRRRQRRASGQPGNLVT